MCNRSAMGVSSTLASEPSSNSEVKVKRSSNKVVEKSSNLPEGHTSLSALEQKKKRNQSPGVRVVGGRIYDSQNGKTCHQCRQKTMDIMAPCKNHKNVKQCTAKYCHKCILNRYGEKAEEVSVLEEWLCPKCRGICNCSFCRKKSGQQPTGILAHAAKSTGFSSVSEMLLVNGSDVQSVKESAHVIKRQKGKENICSENSDPKPDEKKAKKVKEGNVVDHGAIISKKRKRKSKKDKDEAVSDDKKLDCHVGKSKITMQSGQNETNCINSLSVVDHEAIISKKRERKSKKDKDEAVPDAKKLDCHVGKSKIAMQSGQNETNCISSLSDVDHAAVISKKRKRKSKNDKDEAVPDAKKLDCHVGKSKIKMPTGQNETNCISSLSDVEIPLAQGSEMRTVADIELQSEEIGHALQFLEFCAAFEKILELKKDEPEYILDELIRGGSGCIGKSSPVAQFLIRLLLLIQTDSGESSPVINHRLNHKTSWLLVLHKCISSSTFASGNLKLDKFDGGIDSYGSLNSTERLTLVNFVCDEVLCTYKIRNWIDEQNLKCIEKVKDTKEKVAAAKRKKKQLKRKMKDELAEAIIAKNGAPLSVSEHTTIVSKFKVQIAQAHSEMLESKENLCSEKTHCISARTKPILMDNEGRRFWRLNGCGDESNILLQETSLQDTFEFREKWFTYEEEEQIDNVKKYISFKEKGKGSCSMASSS